MPIQSRCAHIVRQRLACLVIGLSASILLVPTVRAQAVSVQQVGVTAVNNTNNALYNLTLTPNAPPALGALIAGTQVLNTDASAHGAFFAVARVPNSVTSALDLIVADPSKAQIVRYPGPGPASYATASPIFTWSGAGSGPKYATSLAADVTGNLYVLSFGVPFDTKPALWVLPFNSTTGAYGAPVLIDNTCGGEPAEVVVAGTAATPVGAAAPAWNVGDVLVLVSDPLNPRVLVYSQAAIQSVLASPSTPLKGPTSTAVSASVLGGTLPVGMDVWPADATHGVSLLISTFGGRVLRFDSGANALAADFASGLGVGLERIKVGTYGTVPYAFIAQYSWGSGRILQLGAPPASGNNTPLTSLGTGANDPQGLAATSSGSVPVSACIAPEVCAPLGNQLATQISGPGTTNLPPTAPVLEESCIINADPRVTVSGASWSCAGGDLDVANYCPGFPSTVLQGSLCGHSGPTGSGFVVVKSTAKSVDENVNNTFIQNVVNADLPLPGLLNLECPQVPIFAWAPRSDLPSIEGTIVEGGPAPGSNYFIDLSGYCDNGGGTTHSVSMYAYGLGLNAAASGLPSGVPGFVTTKFTNLENTVTAASAQIDPGVAATLQGYISQAQSYFNSGVSEAASNGYSCAMNTLASADSFLRANLISFSGAAPPGNINPAGEIDGRLGNLFLTIDAYFLLQPPNLTWPTSDVPPCETLTVAPATVTTSSSTPGAVTLTWSPASPTYPLLYAPASCTLSASDGTFVTSTVVGGSGSVASGPLTILGTYSAQITCSATGSNLTSLTEATANVIALVSIGVTPQAPQIAAGNTLQLTATGTYTDGSMQNVTASTTWTSSNPSVATVSAGLVACNPNASTGGNATISATGATATGSTTGSTAVTCLAPVLQSIVVTPATVTLASGASTQLSATGVYSSGPTQPLTGTVTWTSSAPGVASVSGTGLVTCNASATGSGQATISATSGAATGSVTVACQAPVLKCLYVTPTFPREIPASGTLQLTATGTYLSGQTVNLTTTATWASSAPSVATVSATGLVKCQAPHSWQDGTATISATVGRITASAFITCEGYGE